MQNRSRPSEATSTIRESVRSPPRNVLLKDDDVYQTLQAQSTTKFFDKDSSIANHPKIQAYIPEVVEASNKSIRVVVIPTQKVNKTSVTQPDSTQEEAFQIQVNVLRSNDDLISSGDSKQELFDKLQTFDQENKRLKEKLLLAEQQRDSALKSNTSSSNDSSLVAELTAMKSQLQLRTQQLSEISLKEKKLHEVYDGKFESMAWTIKNLEDDKQKLSDLLKNYSSSKEKASELLNLDAKTHNFGATTERSSTRLSLEECFRISESERDAYKSQLHACHKIIRKLIQTITVLLYGDALHDGNVESVAYKSNVNKIGKEMFDELKNGLVEMHNKVRELETYGYLEPHTRGFLANQSSTKNAMGMRQTAPSFFESNKNSTSSMASSKPVNYFGATRFSSPQPVSRLSTSYVYQNSSSVQKPNREMSSNIRYASPNQRYVGAGAGAGKDYANKTGESWLSQSYMSNNKSTCLPEGHNDTQSELNHSTYSTKSNVLSNSNPRYNPSAKAATVTDLDSYQRAPELSTSSSQLHELRERHNGRYSSDNRPERFTSSYTNMKKGLSSDNAKEALSEMTGILLNLRNGKHGQGSLSYNSMKKRDLSAGPTLGDAIRTDRSYEQSLQGSQKNNSELLTSRSADITAEADGGKNQGRTMENFNVRKLGVNTIVACPSNLTFGQPLSGLLPNEAGCAEGKEFEKEDSPLNEETSAVTYNIGSEHDSSLNSSCLKDLEASRQAMQKYWGQSSEGQNNIHKPCQDYARELEKRLTAQEKRVNQLDEKEKELLERFNKLEHDYNVANRDQLKYIKDLHEKNSTLQDRLSATQDSADPKKVLELQKEIERMRGRMEELRYFLMPSNASMSCIDGEANDTDDGFDNLSDDEFPDLDSDKRKSSTRTAKHDLPVSDHMALQSLSLRTPVRELSRQFSNSKSTTTEKRQGRKLNREEEDKNAEGVSTTKDSDVRSPKSRSRSPTPDRMPRIRLGSKRIISRTPSGKPNDIEIIEDERVTELERMVRKETEVLRLQGVEDCGLILGIDCTASNIFTGKKSFGHRHLHDLSSRKLNFYERVISILGGVVDVFSIDGRFPVYIFGDDKTRDKRIRPLYQDKEGYDECYGVPHALAEYRKQIPRIVLSGPTSFKPLIDASIEIAKFKEQFQTLLIIGDGAVSNMKQTIDSIVEASNYPLLIIMVGVGDGDYKQYPKDPWFGMKKLQEEIPRRKFKNFEFLQYNKEMKPQEFAQKVFSKIPQAYQYCVQHNMI